MGKSPCQSIAERAHVGPSSSRSEARASLTGFTIRSCVCEPNGVVGCHVFWVAAFVGHAALFPQPQLFWWQLEPCFARAAVQLDCLFQKHSNDMNRQTWWRVRVMHLYRCCAPHSQ